MRWFLGLIPPPPSTAKSKKQKNRGVIKTILSTYALYKLLDDQ